jgi:hypothetical protein
MDKTTKWDVVGAFGYKQGHAKDFMDILLINTIQIRE